VKKVFNLFSSNEFNKSNSDGIISGTLFDQNVLKSISGDTFNDNSFLSQATKLLNGNGDRDNKKNKNNPLASFFGFGNDGKFNPMAALGSVGSAAGIFSMLTGGGQSNGLMSIVSQIMPFLSNQKKQQQETAKAENLEKMAQTFVIQNQMLNKELAEMKKTTKNLEQKVVEADKKAEVVSKQLEVSIQKDLADANRKNNDLATLIAQTQASSQGPINVNVTDSTTGQQQQQQVQVPNQPAIVQ
jgi:hypothetical protein